VVSFTNYVTSINGLTGVVANVARTNQGNTFTVRQVMNAGITSANLFVSGGVTFDGRVLMGSTAIVNNPSGSFSITKTGLLVASDSARLDIASYDFLGSEFFNSIQGNATPTANTTHTLPSTSGTLLNTASSYVVSVNGLTGPVGITAGTNITITQSGQTFTVSSSQVTSSTLTYTATTNLDLSVLSGTHQTLSLTGGVTFTTSNLAAGRSVVVRILCDGTPRSLGFPSWKFVGLTGPTGIAASKTGILSLSSFGTGDTNCVAAYAVEP
jgi:hypothetical protein